MSDSLLQKYFRIENKLRRLYWRVFKPKRYGVKGLVVHPQDSNKVALIRNSYGDTTKYNLPGGGYKPSRETSEAALRREVYEELGLDLEAHVTELENLVTTREGKRDNLTIFSAIASSHEFKPNNEIAEVVWVPTDLSTLPKDAPISLWVEKAIRLYLSYQPAGSGKSRLKDKVKKLVQQPADQKHATTNKPK